MIVFHLVGKKHALSNAKNVVSGHLACLVQDWGMHINLRIKKNEVSQRYHTVWHELVYCPDDFYEVGQNFPVASLRI